jgi:hypothetical protein
MSILPDDSGVVNESLLNYMDEEDEREADEDDEDSDLEEDDDELHGDGSIDDIDEKDAAAQKARLEKVQKGYILDKTRYGYNRAMTLFVVWIFERGNRNILDSELVAALRQENTKKKPHLDAVAMAFLSKASCTYHPINLATLDVTTFLNFLLSRTPVGKFLSKSTYGNYRSGLKDLFRSCRVSQGIDFKEELERDYAGLKREAAKAKGQTGARLGEGKKPMSFLLYRKLCSWMIADGSKESLFAWCFLTITWNLVCRSKNTTSIHRNHISWEDDSLTIQFAHQKTDMDGHNDATKRHIYANPEDPWICPVLALGVYLATTTRRDGGMLFGGKNQYERFRKKLKSLVLQHKDELTQIGLDYKEIGVHSIRKGAATYACNGTTCSPSLAAVCNRAGWTLGQVKDTYIQYEAAQDQYAGRVVAGLDVNSHKFSVSPPFFLSSETDFALVKSDIQDTFPFVIETSYEQILKFCLASLMHSKSMLLECLGSNSPMRSRACLLDHGLRTPFSCVKTMYASDLLERELRPTGVPPHVIILSKIEGYQQKSDEAAENMKVCIENAVKTITESFHADLDSRSIGGGQVSMNNLKEMLKPLESKLVELIQQKSPTQHTEDVAPVPNPIVRRPHRVHVWKNGYMSRLPEDFTIDRKMSLLSAWQLWFHGNDKSPPFKYIKHYDLSGNHTEGRRKRPDRPAEVRAFHNLCFVCKRLNEAAGIGPSENPSLGELVALYSSEPLKAILPQKETQRKRLRREDELNWGYACKVMKLQMETQEE